MLDNLKMKVLIVLLAATFIVPAFLLAYQPKKGEEEPRIAKDLWNLVELPTVGAGKAMVFSNDFPAGYRDASMGTAMGGPIKVEGG